MESLTGQCCHPETLDLLQLPHVVFGIFCMAFTALVARSINDMLSVMVKCV